MSRPGLLTRQYIDIFEEGGVRGDERRVERASAELWGSRRIIAQECSWPKGTGRMESSVHAVNDRADGRSNCQDSFQEDAIYFEKVDETEEMMENWL